MKRPQWNLCRLYYSELLSIFVTLHERKILIYVNDYTPGHSSVVWISKTNKEIALCKNKLVNISVSFLQ